MLKAIASLVSDSVRGLLREAAREAVRDMALFTATLILFASAAVFGEIALYLWLRTQTTGYYAALIVAGIALGLALAVGLVANAGLRTSHQRKDAPSRLAAKAAPDPATLQAEAEASARFRVDGDQWTHLAADAEALGKMLGKDGKGLPLVLGAFVVGLLLGRARD